MTEAGGEWKNQRRRKRARITEIRRGALLVACTLLAFVPASGAFAALETATSDLPLLAPPDWARGTPLLPAPIFLAGAPRAIEGSSTATGQQSPSQPVSASPASTSINPGATGSLAAAQSTGQAGPAAVAYNPAPPSDTGTDPDQLLSLYQDAPGQAQTSLDEVDRVLAPPRVFTDLRTLETRLNEMRRPTFNVVDRNSTQSDHLDINQLEVSQDVFFSGGKNNLRFGVQRISYDAPGDNDVLQYAAGATGNWKLTDVSAIAGEVWVNRLEYSGGARTTLATYDVFLTLRPSDVIRIDIDTSRRTFDNIRSLQLGLTAQSYGGSIDFVPTDQLRVSARAFGASYSDANRRRSEELEAVWRIRNSPLIEIGVRGTNFHFTRLLYNGYFNPRDYESGEAMVRVQSDVTRKLSVEFAGSGGAESAHPGGVKPLLKASLQAAYKVAGGWSIDGEAAHFSSRESSSSGFSRTSFTLGLHYRF